MPAGPGSSSGMLPGANNVVRLQLHTPGGPLGPDTPDLTSCKTMVKTIVITTTVVGYAPSLAQWSFFLNKGFHLYFNLHYLTNKCIHITSIYGIPIIYNESNVQSISPILFNNSLNTRMKGSYR